MQVSSQKSPVARCWAQKLYLGMAGLILLGIVTEGLLIGPSLFATTHWGRATHAVVGALLFLFMLLLPVAGGLSRQPARMTLLNVLLCLLALLEVTSADLGRKTLFFAALHPANALLMVGLTVVLLIQGWQRMRERRVR